MKRVALTLTLLSTLAFFPGGASAAECDGVQTSINYGFGSQSCSGTHGVIIDFLLSITRFLGVLIGMVVILMIIVGGIQYIISNGDPSGVKAAKGRIGGAVTALVLYLLMWGILHYLLPGTF